MSANYLVTVWWLDQTIAYLGLIICSILCIIAIRATKSHDLPFRLRFLIYCVHIISVLFFIVTISTLIILPLLHALQISANQSATCYFTYAALSTTGALLFISIINLFFERLYLSFHNTPFALSPLCNIGFRLIACTIWIALGFAYLFASDPTPYNIYEQRIDTTHGITCSTHAKGVDDMMMIIYELIAAMISTSSLFVWILFIYKLYALLKQMSANNNADISADFILIMKKQTMLVGIAVFSSIILWSLEASLQIGQICASIDFIITVFICFLTFKFNEKYFIWFKCDLFTRFCCYWFAKLISAESITVVELKIARNISSSASDDGMHTAADFTVTASGATKSGSR